ncbi:competence damage-inducible protein A [Salmonella enterica subsp. arizonae]|uniref:Competence damage-inducible protein A n=1 Tax=Salmonella enterica subsp. arizonae TaxID=59203 RepID=A0A379T6J1_SALER|nr:competence damage-inducible protein A [Salmonella enterica subsp. arizonae]
MTDSELMRLSEQVGLALKTRGAIVTTAESCTGGWLAKAITDVAGSSAWFERGFVTYSNEAKAQMIGVREETLAQHGAVSEPVVVEMAIGALKAARADFAIAISGIAGRMAAVKRSRLARCGLLSPASAEKGLRVGNASAATVNRCVDRRRPTRYKTCGNNFYQNT